jgi:CBS domain-containing protein
MGAEQEARMVQLTSALAGVTVSRATVTAVRTLAPLDPIGRAFEYALGGFQQDFPVVEGGRLVGMVTRAELQAALAASRPDVPVHELMRRDLPTVEPGDRLETAFTRLHESGSRSLPVVEGGQLVGMVTLDHVVEILQMQSAARAGGVPG